MGAIVMTLCDILFQTGPCLLHRQSLGVFPTLDKDNVLAKFLEHKFEEIHF